MKFISPYDDFINETAGTRFGVRLRKRFNKWIKRKNKEIQDMEAGDPAKEKLKKKMDDEREDYKEELEDDKEKNEKKREKERKKKKRKF